MGVHKATIAMAQCFSSSSWSFKAGARLAHSPTFFPPFSPHQPPGYGELDSTRSPRKRPSSWGCLGCPVLPRQQEKKKKTLVPPEDL